MQGQYMARSTLSLQPSACHKKSSACLWAKHVAKYPVGGNKVSDKVYLGSFSNASTAAFWERSDTARKLPVQR